MPFPPPKRLNTRTTEFVLEQCQRVANQFYSPRVVVTHRAFGTGSAMYPAITTTAITPFDSNTNTFGSGGVDVFQPTANGNTNTFVTMLAVGFNTNTTCLNNFTNNGVNINSGVRCQVYFCAGQLMFGGADC